MRKPGANIRNGKGMPEGKERLDILLVKRFFPQSPEGSGSNMAGLVLVNGEKLKRPVPVLSRSYYSDFRSEHPYVSRGG